VKLRILILLVVLAFGAGAQTPPDLATSALSLEPPQVWEIPALGYGPKAWSILRLTNDSDLAASLRVDVYCEAGNRLPLEPKFAVEPHQMRDIRIEAETSKEVLCWARVREIAGARGGAIQVRAFVETLKGNQLEDYDRKPANASENSAWALLEREVEGQQIYILNASEKPMALTFCVSNKPQAKQCAHKGKNAMQHVAKPRQAVLLDVKKFRQKYFIVEASEPGRTIIELFNDDPGHRRVYTSETSISFDASDTPDN
jgi:hypothetical protein